jgi:hypothetical protein
MKHARLGAALFTFAALFAITRRADAVAGPNICIPPRIAPAASAIPKNFPGFGLDVPMAQSQSIHLVDVTRGAGDLPLTLGPVTGPWLKVVPQAGFTVGDAYTLSSDQSCTGLTVPNQKPISFTIVAEAPIPTTLGTVAGTPTFKVTDYGTSELSIDASYTLSAEMKPWASVYELGINFDGRGLESHPTLSAAGDSVHISALGWCDDASAKLTRHQVKLTATMPFTATLQTDAIELDFTCPSANIVTPKPAVLTPPENTGTTSTTPGAGTHSGGCAVTNPGANGAAGLSAVGLGLFTAMIVRKRMKKGAR